MAKQKVVIVIYSFHIGGAERQAFLLAEMLAEDQDYSVEVLSLCGGGPGLEYLREKDIRCSVLQMDLWHHAKTIRKNKKELRRALIGAKAEIVLSYTYWPNIISGLAVKRSGILKFIWGQRDQGINMKQLPVEAKALKEADAIVSNSEGGKNYLLKHYKLDDKEVQVISNGIILGEAIKPRSKWREELEVPDNAILATMIANIHFYKDHPTLLRAWGKVVKHFDHRPPFLVLAGRITYPERLEELKAIAAELGIVEYLRFTGHVEDIAGLVHAADFAVFSSQAEGLPNGVLEPMAAGLPIVLTDIAGTKACVGDDYPLLCPPENSDEMANKIIQLLEDQPFFEKMGKANRARVEASFSSEKLLNAYCTLFRR
jgi:glycosyltransferase involved in cell wall biosynthesis